MFILREKVRKNKFIKKVYINTYKKFIELLVKISPVLASKFLYRRKLGKKLRLKNPQDFNEKVQWLKLYFKNPLTIQCADKYDVREYVKTKNCEEVLNRLFGVYRDISEIEWGEFPEKFVLKTTNGCGTNIICTDKNQLDKNKALRQLDEWMKIDYGLVAAEIHYSKMTPKIICEEYIETTSGMLPIDYKVFCFNGEPKMILVVTERETGHYQRFFFDLDWNKLSIVKENYLDSSDSDLPIKPSSLNQMLIYSKRLAEGFPFVRIDFYESNNKPILGEMTFTPVGGMVDYFTDAALKQLGDWIDLPRL